MHLPRTGRVIRTPAWVLICLAGLLVASACSGDDGTETVGDDTPPTTNDGTDGDDPVDDDDDPDERAPDSTEPPGATAENFESARGVTAETIKVGITVPDFDALQSAGLSNYQGDNRIAFQPFVDRINAAGGISGRTIEPIYVDFDFLDPITQETACVELTEDNEVFIVLYGLLSESNLCLTDLHDTMVMTDQFQTTVLRDLSGETPWLQLRAADDEQIRLLGSVVAEAGRLDGKTIGIFANGGLNNGADGEILEDTLDELGFDSTVVVTSAPLNDVAAQEAEIGLFVERFKADGVDFVFDLLGGADAVVLFAEAGFSPELAFSVLVASVDSAADPTLLDGAISVAPRPAESYWADPDFRAACVVPILEDNPDLEAEFSKLATGEEQAAGEPLWSLPTLIACNQTMLLEEIGDLVGADLTNESFRAALDDLGPVELHGYGQASFSSDGKWDGLDEFYLQEYDAAASTIRIVGDPIVVDR